MREKERERETEGERLERRGREAREESGGLREGIE